MARWRLNLADVRRWLLSAAMACALIAGLWVSAAQQAYSFEQPHAHQTETGTADADHGSAPSELCSPTSAASDADHAPSNFGTVPALHCHTGSVQLGNLASSLALPIPPQLAAIFKPEPSAASLGLALEPPLAPPRTLA